MSTPAPEHDNPARAQSTTSLGTGPSSDPTTGPSSDPTVGASADPTVGPESSVAADTAPTRRGIPGGRVVMAATIAVVLAALVEAAMRDRIGLWTDITLITVAVIAPIITRAGDRSLPAMMPPLAFLAAVAVAGQQLVETDASLRTREAVMFVQTLGANAIWVVAATVLSTSIAAIGYLTDRRRRTSN